MIADDDSFLPCSNTPWTQIEDEQEHENENEDEDEDEDEPTANCEPRTDHRSLDHTLTGLYVTAWH